MTSAVPMIQALSQNFLTAGGVLILLVGVCTILFAKRGSTLPGSQPPFKTASTTPRILGYAFSSIGVVVASFLIAYLSNMGFVPALFVLASVSLIGVPLILTLEQYNWFSRGADNGTMVASAGLGFIGAAYSFFVLDVLWYVLKLILQEN